MTDTSEIRHRDSRLVEPPSEKTCLVGGWQVDRHGLGSLSSRPCHELKLVPAAENFRSTTWEYTDVGSHVRLLVLGQPGRDD